ncbi:MAG: FAD-dependent oxidoreductase [Gemmatimonadota bacterium]|nr:FAD-dependent oxidoreductase [Gemmatimonadota bacterium]MDH3423010.1 FAD-dependent oxidoreductase [Gemmatimonadota bacterium]
MHVNPMTRRQLLRSLGILGGSSMMLGAMDVWDLKGAPAGPRPQLRGTQATTRVLILGGGITGLIAGYELGKLNYDYRILEARDWAGGLTWTVKRGAQHTEMDTGERQVCDFDGENYINAGAWRIPHTDEGILGYCKELGVPLEIFTNNSDANFFYEENSDIGPLSGRRVRLREVKADLWGATTELLTKAMDQGDIDVPLSEEDQERLVQFLVRSGYLDSDDHLYRPPTSRGSDEPYDLGALLQSGFGARARSLNQETGGPAPLFQPIGGMQEIAFGFQREIGDRLAFNAEVRSIRQTENEVRVVYRDTRTGAEREEVADYVISCLPMSILKKIDVNLSPDMAEAVQGTGHASVAKMGLQMGRRFWEEDEGIFGGHLWSRSLQLGEFSYPCYDYFADKGVLLGYYGSSLQAGLNDLPVRGRVEHVLTQASKVHPQMREEFEHAYCVWWEKVQYSEGAYGRSPSEEILARLSEPDGRLYVGCAGASDDPAWLEGGVTAAWRAVEGLHARVMRG